MAFFVWEDKYSVNVRQFDDEHKRLVALTDQLYGAMKEGKGKQVLEGVLLELVDYTKTHFAHEEKLMSQKNYAGYPVQKAAHDAFVNKVEDALRKFEAGNLSLSVDLFNFLKDWLVKHIQGEDRKYSQYFNGLGIN
jgi:hemerythrin